LWSRSTELPDSPPDTPQQSPSLTSVYRPQRSAPIQPIAPLDTQPHIHHIDDAVSDTTLENDQISASTLDLLTSATHSLHLQQQQQPSQQRHVGSNKVAIASVSPTTSAITIGGGMMPATPEISPDNDVRHHAMKSAHEFVQRIFQEVPEDIALEDAGVELVSPGWSGAVIKSGASASETATSASVTSTSSHASGSAGSDTQRTQRTLYVNMPAVVDATLLREQVLAVLDAASEKLGCSTVMICLPAQMHDLDSVLHGLCYVGGQIVAAATPRAVDDHRLSRTDPVSRLALKDDLLLVAIEL
jgi:hypothetical protein